jgi:hypothetical protein
MKKIETLGGQTILALVAAAGLMLGCGGADGSDLTELEAAVGEPQALEELELGTVQQAWSVESCGRNSTAPNATFTGQVDPAHISPTTYNTCFKAYVVDINSLSSTYAGKPSADIQAAIRVSWASAVPTTQAACEETEGGAIFYRRSGGNWEALTDQVRSKGVWALDPFGSFRCTVPAVALQNPTAGTTYRVAATMRLDPGENPTRKVAIETTRAIFIR